MVQALSKPVTFEQFSEWYPDTGLRYELHNGVVVEMNQPSGDHEAVILSLVYNLTKEIIRLNLPYRIAKNTFVKTSREESAYSPDILLLNPINLVNEALWQNECTVTQAESIPFAVEVVSSNWNIDYGNKVSAYETIGIPEYWIVDYLGLGGRRFIGNPKLPTLSIYSLVEGEHQINQFRANDLIISPTFPELNLTANEVFQTNN